MSARGVWVEVGSWFDLCSATMLNADIVDIMHALVSTSTPICKRHLVSMKQADRYCCKVIEARGLMQGLAGSLDCFPLDPLSLA